jgi:hypothetical protein
MDLRTKQSTSRQFKLRAEASMLSRSQVAPKNRPDSAGLLRKTQLGGVPLERVTKEHRQLAAGFYQLWNHRTWAPKAVAVNFGNLGSRATYLGLPSCRVG